MVANNNSKSSEMTTRGALSPQCAFYGPRARELNTLLLTRGIGLWHSALGVVDQINHALMLETQWMSRLVGGQV